MFGGKRSVVAQRFVSSSDWTSALRQDSPVSFRSQCCCQKPRTFSPVQLHRSQHRSGRIDKHRVRSADLICVDLSCDHFKRSRVWLQQPDDQSWLGLIHTGIDQGYWWIWEATGSFCLQRTETETKLEVQNLSSFHRRFQDFVLYENEKRKREQKQVGVETLRGNRTQNLQSLKDLFHFYQTREVKIFLLLITKLRPDTGNLTAALQTKLGSPPEWII